MKLNLILDHKINNATVPVYRVAPTKDENKRMLGTHQLFDKDEMTGKNLADFDLVYTPKSGAFFLVPTAPQTENDQPENIDAYNQIVNPKEGTIVHPFRYVSKDVRLAQDNEENEINRLVEIKRLATLASMPTQPLFADVEDEDEDEDEAKNIAAAAREQRNREAANELERRRQIDNGKPEAIPPFQLHNRDWYITTAPAIAISATGVAVAAAAVHQIPLYGIGKFFESSVCGNILSGVLLAPLAAAGVAYAATYFANVVQYTYTNGTFGSYPRGQAHQDIKDNAWKVAQQLGFAFLGAELARQLVERSVEAIATEVGVEHASAWFANSMGSFTANISGFSSVELKGALMVMTGLGLGMGLALTIAFQERNNAALTRAQYSKQIAAAFVIGCAIGAAASIGYGNEIASYLMPLATTFGLLCLLPTVTNPVMQARDGADWVGEKCGTAKTWMMSKAGMAPKTHVLPGIDDLLNQDFDTRVTNDDNNISSSSAGQTM